MNYLYDRRDKKNRNNIFGVIAVVVVIVLLLAIPGVRRGLKSASARIGIPLWKATSYVENDAFVTKKSLLAERDELKQKLEVYTAEMIELEDLRKENEMLKGETAIQTNYIRAEILAKPSLSTYDVVVVNKGSSDGIQVGQKVFGTSFVILGEVAEVFAKSSKIKLYSTPGEKTQVTVLGSNISAEAVGRGGQNFEMTFPRDIEIPVGTQIALPGMTHAILGITEKVLFDPRDPFQKVLLRSPLNIEHLSFVEIEK